MDSSMKTYNVTDIFEDIPGDPDNIIMKIPPEICEQMGWKEGDVMDVTAEEGTIHIKKHG